VTIRRSHRRLVIASAAAALAGVAAIAAPASERPAGATVRAEAGAFAWSPAQVRALIAQVEAARRHGLDPADYGLAALRAELELAERLWNTPGSRQLDTLARTSALALANDYRRAARAAAPVSPAELDAALGAGRVGPWLSAMAPADGRAS
jgi:hypothetical protein